MGEGNRATTLQQRLEISERAACGETDPQIATAMQLSPATVRKWRRRAQRQGRSGLGSHMGRPKTGALGQAPPAVCEATRALRLAHPGWGPQTLRLELAHDRRFASLHLPSRACLAAFLKAEKLTRRYERRSELAQPEPLSETAPHDTWEMDAQGVRQIDTVGRVSIINIGDPYSHVRTESWACLHTMKPSTLDYQLALRRAMLRFGRPQRLSLDHDSVFYDTQSASPYPSRLHLWALALGIEVVFIHEGRRPSMASSSGPSDRGWPSAAGAGVRRCQRHPAGVGTPTRVPERPVSEPGVGRPATFGSLSDRQPFGPVLSARIRGRPSGARPGVSLFGAAPLVSPRVDTGRSIHDRRLSLRTGKTWANQEIEITFDPQTQEFICHSEDGQATQRLRAKGLTKADLMGELDMTQFPVYQYAFPWSADACRCNLLFQEMTGTTL